MNTFPRILLEQREVLDQELTSLGFRETEGHDEVNVTLKLQAVPETVRVPLTEAMRVEGCEVLVPYGLGADDLLLRGRVNRIIRAARKLSGLKAETRIAGEEVEAAIRNFQKRHHAVSLPGGNVLNLDRPRLMGILNVTPDSFSDGGRYDSTEEAVEAGLEMTRAGAAILDVGGESTRPGADPVSAEEEKERILPVIEELADRIHIPISVDTYKADVAEAAVEAGASIVNDISGLRFDPAMASTVARSGAALILMHIQGTPQDMQKDPHYEDLLSEIYRELAESVNKAVNVGIPRERLIVDPGIGFGKRQEHNLLLLKRLEEFRSLGAPILVGVSRKSFIGNLVGKPPHGRTMGTAAAVALAVRSGASILRVHDVREMADVVAVADAIHRAD